MAKCDPLWDLLQVGDQSEFVNGFSKVVGQVGPRIGAALTPNYFRFFCDKLANSFTPRFYEYIFRYTLHALHCFGMGRTSVADAGSVWALLGLPTAICPSACSGYSTALMHAHDTVSLEMYFEATPDGVKHKRCSDALCT